MNIKIYTVGTHNTVLNVTAATKSFEATLADVIATHDATPDRIHTPNNNLAYVRIGEDVMQVVCNVDTDEGQEFIAELID